MKSEGTISFSLRDYKSRNELLQDTVRLMDILTKNGYECLFSVDEYEMGIYVIQYAYEPKGYYGELGAPRFQCITAEEQEEIMVNRRHEKCCDCEYKECNCNYEDDDDEYDDYEAYLDEENEECNDDEF